MKKLLLFIIIHLSITIGFVHGSEQKRSDRYIKQQKLSTGLTVAVAEGDFEPRSIGSYGVRIYDNTEIPTDDFLCGTIRPRDGNIEKVMIKDIDGDGKEEIVVIVRSAGSGGYLSADVFQYQFTRLKLVANVTDLKKNANPIKELRKKLKINVSSIERFDQYPVKSYALVNTDNYNTVIISAAQKGENWINNPLLIAVKYLENPNYRFTSILREDDFAENPTQSKITIVLEGYLDDSVRGHWFEIQLKISKDRKYWAISKIKKAKLSARNNSEKEFIEEAPL